jgi:Na+-transporting NADH:ubiquinone oxidoreductase subunit NqrD
MIQNVKTFCLALIEQFNSEDGPTLSIIGMVSSITVASIMSAITDLAMAFGVGLLGALGGLTAKLLWEYIKKRRKH